MKRRNPLQTRAYRSARAVYVAAHLPSYPCCLCGRAVDCTLPGTHALGPTVEHKVPVRVLARMAHSWDHLVELCCDTSTWGIAHKRCQDKQGGAASHEKPVRASRW